MPFHGQHEVPIDADELNKWLDGKLNVYKMNIVQSITTLEESVAKAEDIWGYEDLPYSIVKTLSKMSSSPELIKARRRIQMSELNHILNLTKQKLIDTLLELDKAFPNLSDDYKDTKENTEKVQNIITNNIYGSNVSTNVGIGDKIEQTQNVTFNQIEHRLKEIEALGVDKSDVAELKTIVTSKDKKNSISKKVFAWVGDLTKKTIKKGIEINLPLLMEKLKDLV